MSISDEGRKYEGLRAHLGMKYDPVGVKLLPEKDGYPEALEKFRPPHKMWYCQMVKEAAAGKTILATLDDMACPNSELALGMRQPKYVNIPTMIKEPIKALLIGPTKDADVMLFVLNAKQVMAMSILLGGISAEFRGEVAVCGEATAMVYAEQIPNMTMLCNGARMYGGYTDSELVVGVPSFLVDKIEEKAAKQRKCGGALCGCLISDMPPEIVQNFKSINFEKSSDFFWGKIGKYTVRAYLNKDDCGALKQVTLYIPLKLKDAPPEVSPPFQTLQRDNWLDIFAVLDAQSEGIDLYSGGDAMLRVFTDVIVNSIKDQK